MGRVDKDDLMGLVSRPENERLLPGNEADGGESGLGCLVKEEVVQDDSE